MKKSTRSCFPPTQPGGEAPGAQKPKKPRKVTREPDSGRNLSNSSRPPGERL